MPDPSSPSTDSGIDEGTAGTDRSEQSTDPVTPTDTTPATSTDFKTCFECAAIPDNRLCLLGGYVTDKWTGACCPPGDTSPDCTESSQNVCSDTYTDSQHMYYSYCPNIDRNSCTEGGDSLIFEATPTPRNFDHKNLQRGTFNGESVQNVCTYQVTIPEHEYDEASLYLRFNKLTAIDAYINAGTSFKNASEVLVDGNSTVSQN